MISREEEEQRRNASGRNNLILTLKDAVPGDLSLVFPHRIMVDIEEMLMALDKVTPGIASDETLLYGVEVKFSFQQGSGQL